MNLPIHLSHDQLLDMAALLGPDERLCGVAQVDLDDRPGKQFAVKLCRAGYARIFRWLIWDLGQDGAGKVRCMWHQLPEDKYPRDDS